MWSWSIVAERREEGGRARRARAGEFGRREGRKESLVFQ